MQVMSEIRQNIATRQWVIIAPNRGKRPEDLQSASRPERELPDRDANCPFCPGNEHMLPGITLEVPGPGSDGWQTRVVPNKFPALTRERNPRRYSRDIYKAMPGYGQHEVIIETPRHDQDIPQMSVEEVKTLVETYHKRYVDAMKDDHHMMTIIFRNHGWQAGPSLLHPHSQLIATGIVPRAIRRREEEALRYFDERGQCVFCDILAFEIRDRRRVILENDTFLAFVPFAAEVPFEVWIVPRRHQAGFGEISDEEKAGLAYALREVLAGLHSRLGDPDYNYVVNSSGRHRAGEPHLHWHLRIRPRLTIPAGFEIGSGMAINPSIPEEDAAFLKAVGAPTE